ncbi:hypothetical protein C8A00DRAFT_38779 [Chaetomidium leptoderma]|uniref:Uncharacterized protein n=1 Tax=Chaetomidium leptoderma TaxID=669021 RepID=A0AAN6VC63_9PEZI|nr:hypothetical protein C8A00DRAFT_38779 [Chaetomidium leptoderma]
MDLSVGDQLRLWLEKAGSAALRQTRAEAKKEEKADKTVLILNCASRSLVESDFYRLAPQGQHVTGWASGITKVVQSISAVTREPRGQYFVFFDTRAAAEAYRSSLNHQLGLAKLAQRSNPTPEAEPVTTPFTLLPPQLRYRPQLIPATELLNAITKATWNETGVARPSPPGTKPTRDGGSASPRQQPSSPTIPYLLARHLDHNRLEADMSWSVLVRLAGSKVSVGDMIQAIDADGAERNLPWRLVEERPDVDYWPRQVQTLRSGSGKIGFRESAEHVKGEEGEGEGEEEGSPSVVVRTAAAEPPMTQQYGYTRFVVTFADTAEARRFARTWHRREVVDERTARTMVVNATALW